MNPYLRFVAASLTMISATLLLASCGGGGTSPSVSDSNPNAAAPKGTPPVAQAQTLYVANVANFADSFITTYPANQSGDISPVTKIAGSLTQLADAANVAVDSRGNIYVGNTSGGLSTGPPSCITIYPPNANGNIVPTGTICGSNTGIRAALGAINFDGVGNLYVTTWDSINPGDASILVFAPGATGNIAPIRTISGVHTGLAFPEGVSVDAQGRIYVSNAGSGPCGEAGSVAIFAASASGDAAPTAKISGNTSMIRRPLDNVLDASGNLYVDLNSAILIFRAGAHGDVAPIAKIFGPDTMLRSSEGVALDRNGEIYASTVIPKAILVYPSLHNLRPDGNTSPTRLIAGSNTGLDAPVGITVH